jgi:hypothetical protein
MRRLPKFVSPFEQFGCPIKFAVKEGPHAETR